MSDVCFCYAILCLIGSYSHYNEMIIVDDHDTTFCYNDLVLIHVKECDHYTDIIISSALYMLII